MKIVIAADSYKGSCSANEVVEAIERGILAAIENAEIIKVPVADGGEGTTDALVAAMNGKKVCVKAHDPLGREIDAKYGILPDGSAVIETAAASGLTLLKPEERDALRASTYGTGELISHALRNGAKRIILGLGGSATTDGGAGLAQALGISLLDADGKEIGPGGAELARLKRIETEGLQKEATACEFIIACDVKNRLCGSEGAAAVFGPQKGASAQQVEQLDSALAHYAAVLKAQLGCDVAGVDGTGAAGGMLCGLLPYCQVRTCSGIQLVLDLVHFNDLVKDADVVVTGEGRIDKQSAFGKVPVGVAQRAKSVKDIPVIVIAGAEGDGAETLYSYGIDAIFDTVSRIVTINEAMENAKNSIEWAANNVFRLLQIGVRIGS